MKFDIGEFVGLIITALITLAALLQGIDSAFSLFGRWRKRTGGEACSRTDANTSNRKKYRVSKSQFRWNQRRVNMIFWWLFVCVEIWPLYVYFTAFGTWDALSVWISYVVILFSFPLWSYRSMQERNKRFLRFAIYFICLEMVIANAFVLGLLDAPSGNWDPGIMMLHIIGFLGQRFSLIIFLGMEYVKPWFQSLPEK